jgi:hypothetical protein
MWLEPYWALFARQTFEGQDLRLLQNPNLPLLEVNAGYGTNLALLGRHIWQLKRPCLLLSQVPPEHWQVQHRLHLLEWRSELASSLYIEQVSWTRADWLAQAWCEQHQAQPWQGLVALEISRTMQQTPELCAYVALESDKPVGMALVMPKTGWWHGGTPKQWFSPRPQGAVCGWWAGERRTAEALFAQASADFAGLEVALPADWGLAGFELCISLASDEGRISFASDGHTA